MSRRGNGVAESPAPVAEAVPEKLAGHCEDNRTGPEDQRVRCCFFSWSSDTTTSSLIYGCGPSGPSPAELCSVYGVKQLLGSNDALLMLGPEPVQKYVDRCFQVLVVGQAIVLQHGE